VPLVGLSADRIDIPAGFGVAALLLAALGSVSGFVWVRTHRRAAA
jgi:hypothetical protein